ncbi:unnamed protein product [Linum tenue]|uniref:BED-type domain-containing protein n=1 Tax=Linum tenue TaxID=586396 RepID=A0AAV0LEF4_9ROSI|nr:unnamed protein product [Linum tenue]
MHQQPPSSLASTSILCSSLKTGDPQPSVQLDVAPLSDPSPPTPSPSPPTPSPSPRLPTPSPPSLTTSHDRRLHLDVAPPPSFSSPRRRLHLDVAPPPSFSSQQLVRRPSPILKPHQQASSSVELMARPPAPRGGRGGRGAPSAETASRGGRPPAPRGRGGAGASAPPTQNRGRGGRTGSRPVQSAEPSASASIASTPAHAGSGSTPATEPPSAETVNPAPNKAPVDPFNLGKWLETAGTADCWKDFTRVAENEYPFGECKHCHTRIKAHPSKNGTSAMNTHRLKCLAKVAASKDQTVLNLQAADGSQTIHHYVALSLSSFYLDSACKDSRATFADPSLCQTPSIHSLCCAPDRGKNFETQSLFRRLPHGEEDDMKTCQVSDE